MGRFQLPNFSEPFWAFGGFRGSALREFPTKTRLKTARPDSPLELLLGSRRESGCCVFSLCCSNLCSCPVFVASSFCCSCCSSACLSFCSCCWFGLCWFCFCFFVFVWLAIPPKRHFHCSFRGLYPFALPKPTPKNPRRTKQKGGVALSFFWARSNPFTRQKSCRKKAILKPFLLKTRVSRPQFS